MGILSDISSPITGLISGIGGIFAQNSANKANMKLAEYQNEQNIAMWERNNAYNTPAAQVQRYVEAGLNPNLMYSQGSTGNSSSAPTMQRATVNPLPIGELVTKVMQGLQYTLATRELDLKRESVDMQKLNYEKRNKLLEAQALNELARTAGIHSMNGLQELQRRLFVETFEDRKDIMQYQSNILVQKYNRLVQEASFLPFQQQQEFQYGVEKINKIVSDMQLNVTKMGNLLKQRDVMEQSIKLMATQMKVNEAQAKKIYNEAYSVLVHSGIDFARFQLTPFGQGKVGTAVGIIGQILQSIYGGSSKGYDYRTYDLQLPKMEDLPFPDVDSVDY